MCVCVCVFVFCVFVCLCVCVCVCVCVSVRVFGQSQPKPECHSTHILGKGGGGSEYVFRERFLAVMRGCSMFMQEK